MVNYSETLDQITPEARAEMLAEQKLRIYRQEFSQEIGLGGEIEEEEEDEGTQEYNNIKEIADGMFMRMKEKEDKARELGRKKYEGASLEGDIDEEIKELAEGVFRSLKAAEAKRSEM